MSLPRKIFYNTLVQTLGKVLALAIGITTISLLSRHLEEHGFGQYSTVIAFMGLFSVFADFGLYLYVVREISKPDTDRPKIISNALGLRLAAALVFLSTGAALAFFLPYDPIVKKAMIVGAAAFLFISLNQILVGIFQKHLVQYLIVISETIGRAINLLLVYLLIREGLPLPYFIAGLAAANAAIFFLSLRFAKSYENFSIAFDLKVWKQILAVSWPLIFGVVLNLIYFKTDTVILSWFHSQETVGIYSLPYKVLETLIVFPGMFVGLVMPLLSQSAFTDWKKFQEFFQKSFDALLVVTLLVIIGASFFAEDIINLIKGPREYVDSAALLQILIIAAGSIFLGTLFGYAVVAVNKQKAMVKGYLAGAVTGLILYFTLIPRYSYWGAAIGTVATEVVVAIIAYLLVKSASGKHLSLRILIPALPALVFTILFFYFAQLPWILELGLGICLYAGTLLLFRAIPLEVVKEILFLRKP